MILIVNWKGRGKERRQKNRRGNDSEQTDNDSDD